MELWREEEGEEGSSAPPVLVERLMGWREDAQERVNKSR